MTDTTTIEERCAITELRVGECAHCRKLPDPVIYDDEFDEPAPYAPDSRGWFEAAYAGRCSGCHGRIEIGDRIRRDTTRDGFPTYTCEDCSR